MEFEFNNLLGFINSEEEFRNMLCLYKMSLEDRQDKLVIKKDSAFYFYNVHYYTTIVSVRSYIKKLREEFNILIEDKNFYIIDVDKNKLKELVDEYEYQIQLKVLEKERPNLTIRGYLKNCPINTKSGYSETLIKYVYIDNEILNILYKNKSKYAVYVYGILKFISCRLIEEKEFINISFQAIGNMFGINQSTVKEILKSLMNEGVIIRRTVFMSEHKGNYYYEYKIIKNIKMINYNLKEEVLEYKNINKRETLKNNPNIFYTVYEITDLTNGMKYIGKHKTDNLNDGYMGSGRLLKQNIKIKGIENFTKKILHLCKNEQHMAEMERLEIEKVKAYDNDMYYNLL